MTSIFVTESSEKSEEKQLISFVWFPLLGRAAWTKHICKGKELPDIARDNNYDFNFQVRGVNLNDEIRGNKKVAFLPQNFCQIPRVHAILHSGHIRLPMP